MKKFFIILCLVFSLLARAQPNPAKYAPKPDIEEKGNCMFGTTWCLNVEGNNIIQKIEIFRRSLVQKN